MEEPDPAAIRAAMGGDVSAFEVLVRAYQVPVWRFLRHLLGDAALAEDVTQETFLRIYQRLTSFRFQSRFSAWVFQVARNAGIDALRSRQRRDRLTRSLSPGPPPSAPDQRAELHEALGSLSPRLREALLVVEVLGLGYREAGAVLSVPEGTVKSRVFHARQQLAAWHERGDRSRREGLGP
ncbi:MAG: RNA polymerase sigma factor [Acidimicrobiales bacterium]